MRGSWKSPKVSEKAVKRLRDYVKERNLAGGSRLPWRVWNWLVNIGRL